MLLLRRVYHERNNKEEIDKEDVRLLKTKCNNPKITKNFQFNNYRHSGMQQPEMVWALTKDFRHAMAKEDLLMETERKE